MAHEQFFHPLPQKEEMVLKASPGRGQGCLILHIDRAALYAPSFIQKVQFKPLIFLGPDFFYFVSMGALNPDLLGPYLGLTVWTFAFSSSLWF